MAEAIITERVRKKFLKFSEGGRVLFMSAPCGFGKSTVADELLAHKRVLKLSAPEDDPDAADMADFDFLLFDNLHMLSGRSAADSLVALVRGNPDKKFVILSRGKVPGYLMPFAYSGIMETLYPKDLFFEREETARIFKAAGVKVSEAELSALHTITMGYPLALCIAVRHLAEGEHFDKRLADEIKQEIYYYFEESVYNRLDMPIRRFLLDIAPFEEFGTDLAKMASGSSDAGELLAELLKNSSMLLRDELDKYHFWDIFRDYLMWEDSRKRTEAQRRAVMSRGALYYELHGDLGRALFFYEKSGESDKVSELLIKSTYLHPGMGYYEELENYYMSLDKKVAEQSPALMQAMSMLMALRSDYKASEEWYASLKRFADSLEKGDAAKKEAKSRLAWLDISLPQRGVLGLTETIPAVFALMCNKEITLPEFSVTSAMPSIMNGGKDFSDWSKKDDLLYATLRIPVETVLGRDGVGLADAAIAESKFEKGEDIGARILSLVAKMSEVQAHGTPDIEFAIVGLLAKSQMASGRAEDAYRTVATLCGRFESLKHDRFMPNIKALMCRIALRSGDDEQVDIWFRDEAVKDPVNLKVMYRYRYFTEAMVNIARGDNDAALLTLAPLLPYCETCKRHIDMIHLMFLSALAKKRKGLKWADDFAKALEISEGYGFVRTIGMYGKAALELLEEYVSERPKGFMKKLLTMARQQAVYYPDFLKPRSYETEKLTEAETAVLRLLSADKSNQEIGEILNIKLATVKSHVSHILQKLGVSRRSEAKTAAEKLNII